MIDPTVPLSPPDGATPPFAAPAAEPDALPAVPGYDLLGVLGRGGMSVVYKAHQLQPSRLVALKMVLRGAHAAPEEYLRFFQEAEAVAALRHPNIVEVYEVGRAAGVPYFTLEFVPGGSLADRTQDEPMPPRAAAEVMEPVARAVSAAHAAGFAHRDLKPANILLTADGSPKVADFGLAKRLALDSGLTQTGAIFGTPAFMAPEQAEGAKDVGPLADVWGLGATLYKLLTGRPPFLGATAVETCGLVLIADPVPPGRLVANLPRDLETICLKCLQKEPARRYASAADLADDLRRYLAGETILARPTGPAERAAKWVRRNPAVAALIAAVVVALVGGIGATTAFAVRATASADREAARAADARRAEEQAKDILCKSLFEQARQLRQSRQPGRRWQALDLLKQSADLRDRDRRGEDAAADLPTPEQLRSEAVAAVTQSDVRPAGEWPVVFKYLRISGNGRVALLDTEDTGTRGDAPARVVDAVTGAELGRLAVGRAGLRHWHLDDTGDRAAVAETVAETAEDRATRNAVVVRGIPGGEVRRSLPWPKDPDRGLVVSALDTHTQFFGDRLAAAKLDEEAVWLVLWDLARPAAPVRTFRFPHATGVRYFPQPTIYSPDGRRVAVALADGRMAVVHADGTGEPTFVKLPGQGQPLVRWWFPGRPWWLLRVPTADGRAAAVAWDFEAGREAYRLPCAAGAWVGLVHDATQVVVGTPHGTARLYDAGTGRELGETPALHPLPLTLFRTVADGRVMTASADAGGVRFWRGFEPAAGVQTVPVPDGTRTVGFCPDRNLVVADAPAGAARRLSVIDAGTGQVLRAWTEPGSPDAPVVLPGGRVLTTGDMRLFDWNPKTGTVRGQRFAVSDLATGRPLVTRNTDELVLPGRRPAPLPLVNARGGLAERAGRVLYPELYPSLNEPASVVVWDLLTAKAVAVLTDPAVFARGSLRVVTPDGRFLVVLPEAPTDRRCGVWDVATGGRVGEIALGAAAAFRFDVSADGRWAGAWVREPDQPAGEYRVYSLPSGERRLSLPGRDLSGWSVFSPDGRHLAVVEHAGAVRVYDLDTGQQVVRWERPDADPVRQLQFTPAGGLAVLTAAGPVRVLSLPAVRAELTAHGLGW